MVFDKEVEENVKKLEKLVRELKHVDFVAACGNCKCQSMIE